MASNVPANKSTTAEIPSLDVTQLNTAMSTASAAPLPKRAWHTRMPRAPTQLRRASDKSDKSDKSQQSAKSGKSAKSNKSGKSDSKKSSKLRKLPPVDLSLPLSRLSEALDLAPLSLPTPTTKERRATKAALALRTLILDPPALGVVALSIPAIPPYPQKGAKGRKSSAQIPQLREKDVDRLRTQLLKPEDAKMVIASARHLHVNKPNAAVERAVCLDCSEDQADHLIVEAKRIEAARQKKEKHLTNHRFSTLTSAPPPPPRLPVLLSLFAGLTAGGALPGTGMDATIMTLGLFEPASAMSLHRPLAGALPSADTLRRGFDALINAESKIYLYEGPSHKNIHPPTDRISVYTYWWGFELALPPPTLVYLGRAKSIATSILNLLSVIVYAVPGGTRELAPFVGVLSRYIENEWVLLKSQDKGKGVVCGATWFIPAALTARPWDFGEETIRDRESKSEAGNPFDAPPTNGPAGAAKPGKLHGVPSQAVVQVSGSKGQAEGVVLGIGRGLFGITPSQPTSPGRPLDLPTNKKKTQSTEGQNKGTLEILHVQSVDLPECEMSDFAENDIQAGFGPNPILAFTLPTVDEGAISSAETSAASTPEVDIWVKPKGKRSPSLLSASRFKRSKQSKGKPPPIDATKANTSTASSTTSPSTESSLPTPTDVTCDSPISPALLLAETIRDDFGARTLRLLRGTLHRKMKPVDDIPWQGGDQSSKENTTSTGKGSERKKRVLRKGRSLFEIRRFYNRSM